MRFKITTVLLLSLLTVAACRTTPRQSWPDIVARGTLRIGLDPTYPPFESSNGVGYEGIDIDLGRALAAEMGLTADFIPISYDALYDALETGQVDMLLSALVIRPELADDFATTTPYFNAGEVLVTPITSTITTPADLAGKRLGVELGALGHVTALGWQQQESLQVEIVSYESAPVALTAVLSHTVDAALVDTITARLWLASEPRHQLVTPAVTDEPYAAVVRAHEVALLQEVNRALGVLVKRGDLNRIEQMWLER